MTVSPRFSETDNFQVAPHEVLNCTPSDRAGHASEVFAAQAKTISPGRLTEHAAVFAIELAHTFVADFVRRACGPGAIPKWKANS
jgi:hypothetical protein